MDLFVRHRAHRFAVAAVGVLALGAVGGVVAGALGPGGKPDRLATGAPTATPTPSPTTATPSPLPTPSATPSVTPSASTARPTAAATTTAPRPPAPTSSRPSPTALAVKPVRCGTTGPMTNGTISGIVVDEVGQPVKGVHLYGVGCEKDVVPGVTQTGADGRFALPCHDSKGYEHWAVATPFRWYTGERLTTRTDVGFGWVNGAFGKVRCNTTHRVVLPRAGSVEVQLTEADGSPAKESYGFALFLGDSTAGEDFLSVGTDANGFFRVGSLPPGTYYAYSSGANAPGQGTDMGAAFEVESDHVTHLLVPVLRPTPSPTPTATASA